MTICISFFLCIGMKYSIFILSKTDNYSKKKSDKALSPEEILNWFQTLREQQRALSGKLAEFELDLNEHEMVTDTLKHVNESRKCLSFRKTKKAMPPFCSNLISLDSTVQKRHVISFCGKTHFSRSYMWNSVQ